MKLKTDIKIQDYPFKIGLNTKTLTIGSCFSDVLNAYLHQNKAISFSTNFGNTYNLFSVSKILQSICTDLNSDKIIENDGIFYHFDLHSSIRASSKKDLITLIKALNKRTQALLSEIDILTITLGTSWVYKLKKTNEIVANCHKQAATNFDKILLSNEEQITKFAQLHNYLKTLNPKLKIILTVSPVRHIKDGLVENNLSKSILRVLCQNAIDLCSNVYYFPSYEIMIDDLRDYRFYTDDLIHPSIQAENYILEQFNEKLFDNELKDFIEVWTSLKSSLLHKPFNVASSSHQKFLKNTIVKLEKLHSIKDFGKEIDFLTKQLS